MKQKGILLLSLVLTISMAGCATDLPAPVTDPTPRIARATTDPTNPFVALTPWTTPIVTSGTQPQNENPDPGQSSDVSRCIDSPCILPGHFFLQNPIPPDGNQQVDGTYRFGTTQEGLRDIHHGVEFPNPSGTPVLAAADGEVIFASEDSSTILGSSLNFYGKVVVIEHHLAGIGQTIYTLYAHLSEVTVVAGDQVVAGEMIGKVGRSGSALGSHLHFEVRLGENTYQAVVNPELWLTLKPDPQGPTYGALSGIIHGADLTAMRVTNIRLEYSQTEGGYVEKRIALSTYFDTSLRANTRDNFAISGLLPGWYRLAFNADGNYFSQWVQVEADRLTYLDLHNY